MPGFGPRLIAYGLIGLFCIPGPIGLIFCADLLWHRAVFVHEAVRTDGIITWLEPVRTTRTGAGTYVPVFSFTAADGCLHVIKSDVSVPSSIFNRGDQVKILYRPDNPEIARIDAFSTLWQESAVAGAWTAVWSSIPVFILLKRARRRAHSKSARTSGP